MEKNLLKEELIRIWEIMGVEGNKKLIRESLIDDFIQLVVKAGAKGGPDLMQNSTKRVQKVLDEFPFLKGVDAGDISKLAKGGDEAATVIKKVLGNLEPDELMSFADDITVKSAEMRNLVTDQVGGLKSQIAAGNISKVDAEEFVDQQIDSWIKATDNDVPPQFLDRIKKNIADEVKFKIETEVPNTGPFPNVIDDVTDDVADDVSTLMDEVDDAADDVTLAPKVESELKKQIENSKAFKNVKLPSNVNADDLANQVSIRIAEKLKKQVDMVNPKVWDQLTPTAQFKYLDSAMKELKEINPTLYEKWRKRVIKFFTEDPTKKLKWSKAKQLWVAGMVPVAAYQIKNVTDTINMDGTAGDITISVVDGVLKTALWPAEILTLGQIKLEKDYLDSLKSFEQFAIDNEFATEETAMDMTEKEGTQYFLKKLVGPPDNRKEQWVEYQYNSSLGSFVEKKGATSPNNQQQQQPTNCPGDAAFKAAIQAGFGAAYDATKFGTFDATACKGSYAGTTYTWDGSNWKS